MQAINRAGNLKRITSHPRRKYRHDEANRMIPRHPKEQLAYLDSMGYVAIKERNKLHKKIKEGGI